MPKILFSLSVSRLIAPLLYCLVICLSTPSSPQSPKSDDRLLALKLTLLESPDQLLGFEILSIASLEIRIRLAVTSS